MSKKLIAVIAFVSFFGSIRSTAQVIPDSVRVDWSKAGYPGAIPKPSLTINVKDFGAYGDSIHNDYNAIINAIKSSTKPRVIFFPAGNYLIQSTIAVPSNAILRGAGSDSTQLCFDLSGITNKRADCIYINKNQKTTFVNINSGYTKGSSTITVDNASSFKVKGSAEIRETNGSWDTQPASWATYCVGQMVTITAINGNTLTFTPALRINYTASLYPQIRPVTLIKGVGVECLKITRLNPPTGYYGSNIYFSFATKCWVTGVESNRSQAAHILLNHCSNVTVSGSYFHDSYTYDGEGTGGYGVTLINHTGDCKVENNILRHLRHAMVAKEGANGNVFAYNYSSDPYRAEIPHNAGADMVLHGHYAFANLFEGNIGQTIELDETWGPAGPYNTFFRNRAESYGIIMINQAVNADGQNFVGNEVTGTGYQKGNFVLAGNNHFVYANNINGDLTPTGTDSLPDSSYYLTAKPSFLNNSYAWPTIGPSNILNTGNNSAYDLYFTGNSKTTCAGNTALAASSALKDKVTVENNFLKYVYTETGNVFLNFSYRLSNKIAVYIYNSAGNPVLQQTIICNKELQKQISSSQLSKGIYFIQVFYNGKMESRKVMIQ